MAAFVHPVDGVDHLVPGLAPWLDRAATTCTATRVLDQAA